MLLVFTEHKTTLMGKRGGTRERLSTVACRKVLGLNREEESAFRACVAEHKTRGRRSYYHHTISPRGRPLLASTQSARALQPGHVNAT